MHAVGEAQSAPPSPGATGSDQKKKNGSITSRPKKCTNFWKTKGTPEKKPTIEQTRLCAVWPAFLGSDHSLKDLFADFLHILLVIGLISEGVIHSFGQPLKFVFALARFSTNMLKHALTSFLTFAVLFLEQTWLCAAVSFA